jgi:hypothetical protein
MGVHGFLNISEVGSSSISVKVGTNHSWVKGIQNCLNFGPGTLQMEAYHKNAKIGWGHLKFFSSRTT